MILQTMNRSLGEIWKEIENRKEKKFSCERITFIKDLYCQIGVIGYTGKKVFLLEIDSSVVIEKNHLKKFKGVEIQLVPKNSQVNELTIILLDEELFEVFILFIEDLAEKLIPVRYSTEAVVILGQRINYWRNLFAKINGVKLSPEKQRGLYGELYILQLLLENDQPFKEVLNSWRGAYSANQDFALSEVAAEIKTTKGKGIEVYISNELQLDYEPWKRLYLVIVAVNETAGGAYTLRKIVEDIYTLISPWPEFVEEFTQKLALAGLEYDELEAYNDVGYIIRNINFFEVQDGFPVITQKIIGDQAISETRYKVNVSNCKKYKVEKEKFLKDIK